MQDGRRNIHVLELVRPGCVEGCPVGVDLGDLLAADEADRVEVVDMEIGEDAAGSGDVLGRRRSRVVRRRAHHEDLPDPSVGHGIASRYVARIEPPLETDLHDDPGPVDCVTHAIEGLEVERDGFLAERSHF